METLSKITSILEVALGLGFVIFIHELGHFVLAKWNGVKVEKFSIGFGPTLFGFRKGETEYVLAAVPLGGFVKMLGEGPEEEASKSSDPRAYPNKSVGARMAIISAGVIMNLILGLACFVYAYEMGMDEVPTKVGAVISGSPAYIAGMRPGDEIVSMDGRTDLSFTNLTLKIRLSSHGQVIHFEVKRPGHDGLIPMDIEPRRDASAEVPGIGVFPAFGLTLGTPPYHAPAGLVEPPKGPTAGLQPKDTVIAAGPSGEKPTPVADVTELYRLFSRRLDRPFDVVVERAATTKKGEPPALERVTAALPPNRFVDFGLRLRIEPIVGIREGSPADIAGFRKGDILVKVNGRDDFDPMRLPSECFANAGKPMTFEVERPEVGGPPKVLTLTATPDDTPPWTEVALWKEEPLDVTGLGLAYPVRTRVEGVRPDSPADKAGIKPGDVITSMTIPPGRAEKKAGAKPLELTFDDASPYWPFAFQWLQLQPREPVAFRVNNSNKNLMITPEPVDDWYHTLRGEQFEILTRRTPPMTVAQALRRGWDDTVENVLSIYAMIRGLVQSRVSPKNLGGPLMIGQVAYESAKQGTTDLVRFLGILSINLAVLNFLPIPPLDGGQMIFLAAEKVRGRPLPDSALIVGQWVGLLLVVGLMTFVLYQDFARYVTGWF